MYILFQNPWTFLHMKNNYLLSYPRQITKLYQKQDLESVFSPVILVHLRAVCYGNLEQDSLSRL